MYATSLTDSISLPVGGASNMGDIPGGAFFLISNDDMKSSGTLDVLGLLLSLIFSGITMGILC